MKCPICGSMKLALYDTLWPLSILMPKKFKCGTCGWTKPKEEVLQAGGLEAFSGRKGSAFHKRHKHSSNDSNSNWERIDNIPNWAYRKMKKRRTNKVNGEHYVYLRKGNDFFRRKK
jgi:hypothetical protein